jgi:hypothetical protein
MDREGLKDIFLNKIYIGVYYDLSNKDEEV